MLVLAPREEREHVLARGATWVDLYEHANRTAAFAKSYRQGSPGSRRYHIFCHVRWLAVAAALRERPIPTDGAVAVLTTVVTLFSRFCNRPLPIVLVE